MDEISQGSHLVIPESRVPVGAYQAIYHKLTKKTEKLSQTFDDIYQIKFEDVVQLNTYLEQSIMQYPIKGKNCECTLSLKRHESFQCSSFEKFHFVNFNHAKPTSIFNYQLDFFTIIPTEIPNTEDIVQKFKVNITIDQDFVEENQNLPPFMFGALTGNNINLSIEYSDFAVARNLQSAVQEWVGTLTQRKKSPFIKLLDNNGDFFNVMVPRLLAFSALIGGAIGWPYRQLLDSPVSYILFYLAYALMAFVMGHIIVVSFFRNLALMRPITFLLFTKGDKDRYKIYNKNIYRKKSVIYFIVVILGIGLAINLVSAVVAKKMGL